MTGSELKAYRDKKGWTQVYTSGQCEVSPQTWNNWERGYSSIPLRKLAVIRKVFGIRVCICKEVEHE